MNKKNAVKNLKKYIKNLEYWKILEFNVYLFVMKIRERSGPLDGSPISLCDYKIIVLIY